MITGPVRKPSIPARSFGNMPKGVPFSARVHASNGVLIKQDGIWMIFGTSTLVQLNAGDTGAVWSDALGFTFQNPIVYNDHELILRGE